MPTITILCVGLVAGFHAALYGAYKDAPHESFLLRRFIRELAIAAGVSAVLGFTHVADHQSLFIVYVSIFALSRIVTEFWKLFLRVEPQEGFRIPTQMHVVTGVLHHRGLRLLLGLGFLASIYGLEKLFAWATSGMPTLLAGLVAGAGIGLALAASGAYKDGTIEGFYWHKFAKSPTLGAIGGLIAATHTTSMPFIVLAAVGTERMLAELLFKLLVPGYAPGKFRSIVGPFKEWYQWRRYLMPPYASTWALYAVLLLGAW